MPARDSLENTMDIVDQFTVDRDWEQFHTVKNLMASISIEASELNEILQWSNPSADEVRAKAELMRQIADETADVMVYCLRLCSVLELDPVQIMLKKIEKNRTKYPIDKVKGSSKKYTSYQ